MKRETKFVLGFAMLLTCGTSLIVSCSEEHAAMATIRFSQARLETNGSLKVDYDYTTPSGTILHESDFLNEKITAESSGNSGSSIGMRNSSPSGSSYHISVPDVPSPPPSLLVTTGKTYYLKPNDRLAVYSFTNNSGQTYRGELSLERQ